MSIVGSQSKAASSGEADRLGEMRGSEEASEGPGAGGTRVPSGGEGDTERAGGRAQRRGIQKRSVFRLTLGTSPSGALPTALVSRGREDADGLELGVICSFVATWLFRRSCDPLPFSTSFCGTTPLRRPVSTLCDGRGSNSPATMDVAVLRR